MTKRETTDEFAYRLNQAVAGHPLAPPTPFGRQKWLQDKLAKEAKLDVSANTIHKWVHGMARPREDNIRKIAKALAIDDVWLSLGRSPVNTETETKAGAAQTGAGALVLAGLIEMAGGKVTFPTAEDEAVSLFVHTDSSRQGITVVSGQVKDGKISYMVPEPVGSNRIVSVQVRESRSGASGCFMILDLTEAPRQNFGGFSVITGETRPEGQVKIDGQRTLLRPNVQIEELAGT